MRNRWKLPLVSLLIAPAAGVIAEVSIPADDNCNPATVDAARMTFHRTWFEEADVLYDVLIRVCPETPRNFAYAAVIDNLLFRESADNIAAAEDMLATVDLSTHSFARALVHFAKGELARAESVLTEYLASTPDDSYAEHVLGFTLIDQGRPQEGADVLSRLLDRDPAYFPARNHLAYALMMTDRMDEAIANADAFVDADPLNPSAWDTRASILDAAGRREDALASLTRSVLLDPRFAYGWSHMADILGAAGEWSLAQRAYRQALLAGDRYGAAFLDGKALVDSAYKHFRSGEADKSKDLAHKALAIGRAAKDPSITGGALAGFCRLALRAKDEHALASCSSQLTALAQDSADQKWEVYSIHMRAEFARMGNDLATADALYLESLQISEAIGLTGMVAAENFNRSFVSVARGDLDSATQQVREFFRVSATRNDGEPDPYGLIALTNLLVAREQLQAAAEVSFAAQRIFDEKGIVPDPADAQPLEAAREVVASRLTPAELQQANDGAAGVTTQQLIDLYL